MSAVQSSSKMPTFYLTTESGFLTNMSEKFPFKVWLWNFFLLTSRWITYKIPHSNMSHKGGIFAQKQQVWNILLPTYSNNIVRDNGAVCWPVTGSSYCDNIPLQQNLRNYNGWRQFREETEAQTNWAPGFDTSLFLSLNLSPHKTGLCLSVANHQRNRRRDTVCVCV